MADTRPFRFGAGAFIADSAAAWCDTARRIEAQGYDTLITADHFVGQQLAPGPALTAAALVTTTIRVGTTVYAADYRHPVVLAQESASVDVLSGGRLEFGIGAGWARGEYDRMGVPFDRGGIRVDRMQEALRVVRGLWDDEPFSFAGNHFAIDALEGWPKPVQKSGPPIFIGGGGQRLLSFAAQEADIVGILAPALPEGGLRFLSDTEERVCEQVSWVREAAGDRFADIELAMLIWKVRVTDDPLAEAEEIARTPGELMNAEQILASPYNLIGSVESITERVQELRERFGVSYFSVFPNDREVFAPVVARLAGT